MPLPDSERVAFVEPLTLVAAERDGEADAVPPPPVTLVVLAPAS